MKQLFTVITFVLSISVVSAQNCTSLLTEMKDDFEPDKKGFQSNDIFLTSDSEKKTLLMFEKTNKGFYLALGTSGICVDKGEELLFLFDDKTIEKLYQYNNYNCRGASVFLLDHPDATTIKTKLQTSKLSGLRLMAKSGYQTYKLSADQSKLIFDTYNCIIK